MLSSVRPSRMELSVGLILWCCLVVMFGFSLGDRAIAQDQPSSKQAVAASAVPETTKRLLKTFVEELVAITPGEGKFPKSFQMGGGPDEPTSQPKHEVTFQAPFAIAKYEVPQNLYEAVMGNNPSRWKGVRNSVELMTWSDANLFCRKLTTLLHDEKLIPETDAIRLPTEAEWEYCCRAGTTTVYSFGDEARAKSDAAETKNPKFPKASILGQYAWHTGNAAGNDPPVGALKPNPWGLYDMHGYLWEFTADGWSLDYKKAPTDGTAVLGPKPDVAMPDDEGWIVVRGGSWKDPFQKLTSTYRHRLSFQAADDAVGIRCVKARKVEKK